MQTGSLALTGAAALAIHQLDGFRDREWAPRWCAPANGSRAEHVKRLTQWIEPIYVDGVAIVPVAQGLADAADEVVRVPRWPGDSRFLEPDELIELAVEHALRDQLTTTEELSVSAKKRKSAALLRRVLQRRPVGVAATESYAETRALQVFRSYGLPEPWRQVSIRSNRQLLYRADFLIPVLKKPQPDWVTPADGVLIEIDGRAVHDGSFERDYHRNAVYKTLGYEMHAFSPNQIELQTSQTVELITRSLRGLGCRRLMPVNTPFR